MRPCACGLVYDAWRAECTTPQLCWQPTMRSASDSDAGCDGEAHCRLEATQCEPHLPFHRKRRACCPPHLGHERSVGIVAMSGDSIIYHAYGFPILISCEIHSSFGHVACNAISGAVLLALPCAGMHHGLASFPPPRCCVNAAGCRL